MRVIGFDRCVRVSSVFIYEFPNSHNCSVDLKEILYENKKNKKAVIVVSVILIVLILGLCGCCNIRAQIP